VRLRHFREGLVEIGGTSSLNELRSHSQRPRRNFCFLQHVLLRPFAEGTWLPQDSDPTDSWHGLCEQFQPLADQIRADDGQPGDITGRRARLVTSVLATGSEATEKTMGIALVACLAATAAVWSGPR